MSHKVTPRTEQTLVDLRRMAALLRPDLGLASTAARLEWLSLQARWPSPAEIAAGTVALSQDELDQMLAKVRRFAEILSVIKPHGGASGRATTLTGTGGVSSNR